MKSPLELIIDTTDNTEIRVGLIIDGKKDLETVVRSPQKSQVVLPLIEKLLAKYKRSLTDITAITINPGPGSFTGIRVGLSIANTLAALYNIPINGKKSAQPVYE